MVPIRLALLVEARYYEWFDYEWADWIDCYGCAWLLACVASVGVKSRDLNSEKEIGSIHMAQRCPL